MAAAVIEARDIALVYGERRALDGLSLAVPQGGVFGLLGPNGSGKSSFLTMVAAMAAPPAGTLRVFGEEPRPALRQRVGVVFQESTLDPVMTVQETLALAAKVFRYRGDAGARSQALLEQVGLAERLDDPVASLSGGMRRRLEAARALLHEPDLLLLDEPTTGVDPGERALLWEAIRRDSRERTVLLATNDLAEADQVCEQVAFVRDGRVLAQGTPEELKLGLRREAVRLTWPEASASSLAGVSSWPGVGAATREGDTVHLSVDDAGAVLAQLFAVFAGEITSVNVERTTLEDAYFHHVGRRASAPAPEAVA